MYQPSFRGIAMALLSHLPRNGLGAAFLGARLLVAFALPSHVMAQ